MPEKLVSLSDISTYKRCRKRWDYSSSLRQSWRHKRSPKLYLSLGTAIHAGLDANAKGQDWLTEFTNHCLKEQEKEVRAFEEEVGMHPTSFQMEEFKENQQFAFNLLNQYFNHYGTENPLKSLGLTPVASEVSFKIPLSDETYFVGTIDLVAVDDSGNIFLGENKTYSGRVPEDLQYHFQITGYGVAWEWLTGERPAGAFYNGITKHLIKEPKVLKSGKLSVAKDQRVTTQSYLNAMKATGQDPFDEYYLDYLTFLEERERQGDSRFFHREKFFYKGSQLREWKQDFLAVVDEMLDSPRIYRSVPYDGCSDCWFTDLCHGEQKGQDIEPILTKRYKKASYGTVEAVSGQLEPTMVTSVADLLETLKGT